MAEEIVSLEAQDIPVEEGAGIDVEEGAGIDADNAEDVSIDSSWLSTMEKRLASAYSTESSPFTICRVPANIRKCDPAAYNPRIVSIGPFHRGRKNLQAMEKQKWGYLHEVIYCREGGNNLEKFLKKMKVIEKRARNCYSEKFEMINSKEFVEMMMLDGCFVIFIILKGIGPRQIDVKIRADFWMSRLIYLDMLLLENQLPFFVLECLWELIGQPRDTLRNKALSTYDDIFSYKLQLIESPSDIRHLLHLLHLSIKPADSPTRKSQTKIGKTLCSLCPTYLINTIHWFRTLCKFKHKSPPAWNMIPSATELQEAGVRFQLKQARSFCEVGFERGLMEMPHLWIFEETHICFRNFIAFEQCFPKLGNQFTSYCCFIDFLVDTPRDVSILREADIIRNDLGSNEEVALLFNKLSKEIVRSLDCSYLADLMMGVNKYTQKRWPKWRAKLARDYFGNPLAFISFIFGVVMVLILTFIQTYFSVFAYFNPPKP